MGEVRSEKHQTTPLLMCFLCNIRQLIKLKRSDTICAHVIGASQKFCTVVRDGLHIEDVVYVDDIVNAKIKNVLNLI